MGKPQVSAATRRWPFWLRSILCVGVVLCTQSNIAHASPDKDAERMIAQGLELRQAGKDEEALALFNQALTLAPTPRARAQVALARQALGAWVTAEADLVAALAATSDPWIIKNRAALESALATVGRHLGSLEVHGTDGAEVILDGVSIGKLPTTAPFRVEAGPRTIELRKPGFYSTARTIDIPAGSVTRSSIVLAPLSSTPAAEPSNAGAGARAVTENPPTTPRTPETAEPADPGHVQRLLGWTFALTGVGALAVGGVGLVVRSSLVDDYNTNCPGLGVAQPAGCPDKIDAAGTWLTVSTISLVAGGVFALGGAALVVTAPARSRAKGQAAYAPLCVPNLLGDSRGISCGITF